VSETRQVLERVFREESGRVTAALVAQLRDFDLAEDALQDATAAALERWSRDGVPERPGAWLLTAARRKALDRLRRRATRLDRQAALALEAELAAAGAEPADDGEIPDERLRLIFTCCHPALSAQAQVALTLRTLGGLSVPEIARAFLVDEAAMARRLVRARAKIRDDALPYEVPAAAELGLRARSVLAVVYLIFNEGYAATAGDTLVRRDFCAEAIRLARLAVELLPGEPEAHGLLALLLLQDARRDARVDSGGVAIGLEEQDRARWDRAQIEAGLAALARAAHWGRPGPYQLQAAIAAAHATSPSFEATDWPRILALYDRLLELQPSPVVELNRAVALGFAAGPEAGLARLEGVELGAALAGYPPLQAARADLLRRAGRLGEAKAAYERALGQAGTAPERAFLERRLAALEK
jgi:RNA polymerase sigma-70 factor (ECF subfamily)